MLGPAVLSGLMSAIKLSRGPYKAHNNEQVLLWAGTLLLCYVALMLYSIYVDTLEGSGLMSSITLSIELKQPHLNSCYTYTVCLSFTILFTMIMP